MTKGILKFGELAHMKSQKLSGRRPSLQGNALAITLGGPGE